MIVDDLAELVRGLACEAGTAVPIPALLTRMSTRPSSATVSSATRMQSAGSETSAVIATQRRPSASTSALVCSSRSVRRAQMAMSAPTSASPTANAAPSPEEAPVMTATLPSSRKRSIRDMGGTVPGSTG